MHILGLISVMIPSNPFPYARTCLYKTSLLSLLVHNPCIHQEEVYSLPFIRGEISERNNIHATIATPETPRTPLPTPSLLFSVSRPHKIVTEDHMYIRTHACMHASQTRAIDAAASTLLIRTVPPLEPLLHARRHRAQVVVDLAGRFTQDQADDGLAGHVYVLEAF